MRTKKHKLSPLSIKDTHKPSQTVVGGKILQTTKKKRKKKILKKAKKKKKQFQNV